MMDSPFLRKLRQFRSEECGSVTIETAIIFPTLFMVILALFTAFHAFQIYSVNQKAAYTIADMVSRETNPIDPGYLQGTRKLLSYMTNADIDDVSVRVTLVYYDLDTDTYSFDWSAGQGDVLAITPEKVAAWNTHLPTLPDQERIIVVETFHYYDPPFDTGLMARTISNFTFTKPRYAAQVLWSEPAT